jgi:hypothetical protein
VLSGVTEQALLNLVANSVDAMADRGSIAIASRLEGDSFVITIADTGCGVPNHIRDRIFEPFITTKPVGQVAGSHDPSPIPSSSGTAAPWFSATHPGVGPSPPCGLAHVLERSALLARNSSPRTTSECFPGLLPRRARARAALRYFWWRREDSATDLHFHLAPMGLSSGAWLLSRR